MTDWRRVEEMFGAVLKLDPDERPAYLKEACGDDEGLRREVESLLAANEDISTTFLAMPPAEPALLVPPKPLASGDAVGPYRLLDKIGEGGMGTVFLGERADGAFDRQVAVKFLRHGMETEGSMLRFDLERRILATLDHPGIARLLDGGATETGAPYVVMEWVDGEPIDTHCERHQLSSVERVDLFLEVAEAAAAAHRSLVIHRDIKPSNVLVDQQGKAKLLDFGIAKILDAKGQDGQSEMTQSWHRVLTPSYASPEQIRGERVTAATDVFLLGILLYKLLTGQLPYRFTGRSLVEVEAMLTSERPKPASQVVRDLTRSNAESDTVPRGIGRIDSDLDHIVLKALRSDPSERYGSVAQMADDLWRFRHGQPIRARIGNQRYLIKKFTQRHWRGLTLAVSAFVCLTLFAADRAIQVERRDRALAQSEVTLARLQFIEDLFWQADPDTAKGQELTVAEALARGEVKLADVKGVSPEETALRHALLGRIRLDLGEYQGALVSLEKARDDLAALPDKDATLQIAEGRVWAEYSLAQLHQLQTVGDKRAEEIIEASIASARRAYDQGRALEATDPRSALSLINPLVDIYCLLERWDEAANLTQETMQIVGRLKEDASEPMAIALGHRALVLKTFKGDLESARDLYLQALDIYVEIEGEVHPQVANLRNQLGLIAFGLGDYPSALESQQAALTTRKRLFPEGHLDIHRSYGHLATLFRVQGDLEQAIRHLDEAVLISEAAHGATSPWTVRYVIRKGEVLIEAGRLDEAETLLREQLTPERRAARPERSRLVVRAEGALGVVLLMQGRDGGEKLLGQSLEVLQEYPDGYEDSITWLESYLPRKSQSV